MENKSDSINEVVDQSRQNESTTDTTIAIATNPSPIVSNTAAARTAVPSNGIVQRQQSTIPRSNGFNYFMYEQLSPAFHQELQIEAYQKIVPNCGEASSGLATWLSVYTNDAPVLVLTTSCSRFGWCEHHNQSLKIYTSKRLESGDFVDFNEVQSVPLRCCLSCLTTNPFNKKMFAGGTLTGEITVWLCKTSNNHTVQVNEICSVIAPRDSIVAVEWLSENHLLTCHTNAYIQEWILGNTLRKANQYKIPLPRNRSQDITAIAVLGLRRIVVGTNDGGVYYCSFGVRNRLVEISELRKHPFTVNSMSLAKMDGRGILVSCDISGQVYFHDLNKINEKTDSSLKLPMAFQNVTACKNDARYIFAPGTDGSLECYRIDNNHHMTIKGALRGIGSFVKLSDNENWIIIGLYEGAFQIFQMKTIDTSYRSYFGI